MNFGVYSIRCKVLSGARMCMFFSELACDHQARVHMREYMFASLMHVTCAFINVVPGCHLCARMIF